MNKPVHGIVGDEYGLDLPETQVLEDGLADERKAARFSKTNEFKRLKEHLTQRIDYYQKFLPDGTPIIGATKSKEELGNDWMVANIVTAEFQAIINAYEQAAETIKDAARRTGA